jgi:hypothetical protein
VTTVHGFFHSTGFVVARNLTSGRRLRSTCRGMDLDAALTAEAHTIAAVDDVVPLVPQPERRVADA